MYVEVGTIVSVGITVTAGTHETKIMATSKPVTMFLIFIDYLIVQGACQLCLIRTEYVQDTV